MANEAFSLKSASVRWAGWATVTYGRVGKLKTRVGKGKIFSALRAEFCPPWPETLPAPLLDFPDFNTVIGSHQHALHRQILLCGNDVVNHFVCLRLLYLSCFSVLSFYFVYVYFFFLFFFF